MYRREAEVLHVIRSTRFVQQNVPIGPADGAAVEVVDHRTSVHLTQGPILEPFRLERVSTALGENQVLVGERFAYEPDVVKHRLAAAPRLVPVISNTPHVLRSFWIVE